MMKSWLLLMAVVLLSETSALAVEVAGVNLAPEQTLSGETLRLNGYGIRTKFFFKIYIGALYTAQPVATTGQAVALSGSKLIRMDFLYEKVEKEKIVGAFAEGLAKNSPGLIDTKAVREFLGWFDADFVKGDRVDLVMAGDGTVSASHNGRRLGSINDPGLARGVLLIYLGDKPADDNLKEGMLGKG
jgi:Chalcone isomerase-like